MDSGLVMTFLDDNTLAFGEEASLKSALDTRDGKRPSLDSNPVMSEQMAAVDSGPLWSVLDQQGTQAIMMSAMAMPPGKSATTTALRSAFRRPATP